MVIGQNPIRKTYPVSDKRARYSQREHTIHMIHGLDGPGYMFCS